MKSSLAGLLLSTIRQSGYAVSLKTAMEGGTPQTRYRLAAGHSGASVCRTCSIEPPSLQRRAMHRLKHWMKHLQVMQAKGERSSMFLAAEPEKVAAKTKN